MSPNIQNIYNIIYLIVIVKVFFIGEFNVFSWIRYGREYRLWYSSRESFGEYLERTGKKKGR